MAIMSPFAPIRPLESDLHCEVIRVEKERKTSHYNNSMHANNVSLVHSS